MIHRNNFFEYTEKFLRNFLKFLKNFFLTESIFRKAVDDSPTTFLNSLLKTHVFPRMFENVKKVVLLKKYLLLLYRAV